jgi:hypothetical protein
MGGFSLRGARISVGTALLAVALGALTIFAGGAVGHAATAATWAVQASPNATRSGGQLESIACSSPTACTAVGNDLNASGITVTLAERWDGSAWQRQTTPNPPGDTTTTVAPELFGVSCPTSTFCEAVGQYGPEGLTTSMAQMWNGSAWTMQSFPVPANSSGAGLAQVSCTSATFCEAVGSYFDETSFQTVPLAAIWNGTSWSIQSTPSLPNTAAFTAVSCTSAKFCEAWGGGNAGNPGPEVAEQWNGTAWALQTVPSDAVSVNSVSCTSAKFCEAVGTTAVYNWNGTQWTAQTLPASLSAAGLNGVSCTSAKFCELVGVENTGSSYVGVAGVWNGAAWTAQSPPSPSGAGYASLNAVSCTSAKACEAAGDYKIVTTAGDPKALAEAWNGTSWALQQAVAPGGATANELLGVSCVGASFCAAVGWHINSAGDEVNLAEIWNGTSWLITTAPNLAGQSGADDNELSSVSCVSASFCQAVGTGPSGPSAAVWNGTSWTIQAIPGADVQTQQVSCATTDFCMEVQGNGDVDTWNGLSWAAGSTVPGFSNLSSVSCLSASFCEVVGYDPSGGNAAAWNGTSWTDQATPGPASNSFNSVSCNSATACEAVGQALGTNDETVPLAEVWNGSAWTIQSTPSPANSQSSSLASVSCTSASSCTAVGQYASATPPNFGEPQTLAEVWDGTAWTIPATPDPSSTAQNILNGVSCGAAGACTAVGLYTDPGNVPATLIEAGD